MKTKLVRRPHRRKPGTSTGVPHACALCMLALLKLGSDPNGIQIRSFPGSVHPSPLQRSCSRTVTGLPAGGQQFISSQPRLIGAWAKWGRPVNGPPRASTPMNRGQWPEAMPFPPLKRRAVESQGRRGGLRINTVNLHSLTLCHSNPSPFS